MVDKFNIRVYGLWMDGTKVLIADEQMRGFQMVKFPGGGLKHGEGLHDGLRREFIEETGLEINILDHFYTTDFFQKSAFSDREQVVSVYYRVSSNIHELPKKTEVGPDHNIKFKWQDINELSVEHLTFPIDRHVLTLLKKTHSAK